MTSVNVLVLNKHILLEDVCGVASIHDLVKQLDSVLVIEMILFLQKGDEGLLHACSDLSRATHVDLRNADRSIYARHSSLNSGTSAPFRRS